MAMQVSELLADHKSQPQEKRQIVLCRVGGQFLTGVQVCFLQNVRRIDASLKPAIESQPDHLTQLFAETNYLKSYPPFVPDHVESDKDYSIVAPEGILWAAKSIKNYWTEMVAGPDILKSEIIRDVYGVDE